MVILSSRILETVYSLAPWVYVSKFDKDVCVELGLLQMKFKLEVGIENWKCLPGITSTDSLLHFSLN